MKTMHKYMLQSVPLQINDAAKENICYTTGFLVVFFWHFLYFLVRFFLILISLNFNRCSTSLQ